jgi:ketosteroid isomerase-like protein
MKRIFSILVTSIAMFLHANGQTPGKTNKQSGNVEQTIMKIEKELVDALLKGDASANEQYMSASAIFVGPDGVVINKSQVTSMIKSGDLKYESSTTDDMKVQVYGNTAVATYRTTDKGKYKDFDISGQFRWIDVFVKQSGGWQVVATQGTKLMPL